MGLSKEERLENVESGLNAVCYGLFRYDWGNKEQSDRLKELIREIVSIVNNSHLIGEDGEKEIGGREAGFIFDVEYLENVLKTPQGEKGDKE